MRSFVIGNICPKIADHSSQISHALPGIFHCGSALPVGGKTSQVDVEDGMFLIDDRVMLDRAETSKFGFGLGAVTLPLTKRP